MSAGIQADPEQSFRGCAASRKVLADYYRWDTVVSEQKRSGGTQPVLSKEERNRGRIYGVLLLCIGSEGRSSRKDSGEHPDRVY